MMGGAASFLSFAPGLFGLVIVQEDFHEQRVVGLTLDGGHALPDQADSVVAPLGPVGGLLGVVF